MLSSNICRSFAGLYRARSLCTSQVAASIPKSDGTSGWVFASLVALGLHSTYVQVNGWNVEYELNRRNSILEMKIQDAKNDASRDLKQSQECMLALAQNQKAIVEHQNCLGTATAAGVGITAFSLSLSFFWTFLLPHRF